jgi:long-chain acyl-CoA synthetase
VSIQERMQVLLAGAPAGVDAIADPATVWTWSQVSACAASVDAALAGAGLGAGARVGMILENHPAFLAVATANAAAGRCTTTLSPLQPPERLCRDIEASELPVVVGSAEGLAHAGVHATAGRFGRIVELSADGTARLLPTGAGDGTTQRVTAPGVAIEMFTSGTTGAPKRVGMTYQQIDVGLAAARIVVKPDVGGAVALSSGATIIANPLVHIGGLCTPGA